MWKWQLRTQSVGHCDDSGLLEHGPDGGLNFGIRLQIHISCNKGRQRPTSNRVVALKEREVVGGCATA
jgi:hypothetical protein